MEGAGPGRPPRRRNGAPAGERWRRFRRTVVLGGALLIALLLLRRAGEAVAERFEPAPVEMRETWADAAAAASFDHGAWTEILAAHVDDAGWVDYAAIAADDRSLDRYLAALATAPVDSLGRDDRLALLINAYNAFTLRLILDHRNDGGLESIRDIPRGGRWAGRRWNLGGTVQSLDEIEHERIRPHFREPRIHFALVCAAVGCPPLRAEAYTGKRLDRQLGQQARFVHAHETWLRYGPDDGVLHLTPLYDWYEGDFEQVAGAVEVYAARFREDLVRMPPRRVSWLGYDWRLNDVSNRAPR